ncbi:hypothetical protein [Vibrio phage phiKT1024]|nr:hypothetical protein [Vibrio phage phiKT1024]
MNFVIKPNKWLGDEVTDYSKYIDECVKDPSRQWTVEGRQSEGRYKRKKDKIIRDLCQEEFGGLSVEEIREILMKEKPENFI